MPTLYSAILFILMNNFYNNCFGLNTTQHLFEDSGTVVSNSTDGVSETQHATCHISTEELVANAESTVTRVLTGVCNAEVVERRFENLERLVRREFEEIKEALNSLAGHMRENVSDREGVDPREEEIERLNNTVTTINTPRGVERTFAYFMRVEDFYRKTSRWGFGRYERSPKFYLPHTRRYAMYVKVTPRDVLEGTTYVKIGAGLTRGIHDETLDWPFYLKHRIEILDHSDQGFRMDLRASIVDPTSSGHPECWDKPTGENPEETSIRIPAGVILAGNQQQSNLVRNNAKYLWKGGLVVKLTVYL